MIVRHASLTPDIHDDPERGGRLETVYTSNAGGLTQFGAYVETLHPGAGTSWRHWHEAEDEFLYVIDGEATVIDNDGEHLLHAGDAAVWPFGVPNAHHVVNRSGRPSRHLIVGSRVRGDVCHYPDSGETLRNGDTSWEVTRADGSRIRGGDLPAELLGLPARWGSPQDPAAPRPSIIRRADAPLDRGSAENIARFGPFAARLYSDAGGLTQFGAFTETLEPGARSGDRHWHEAEDEFLLMLDGHATVIEDDGPHDLAPGDAACWPAGVPTGHHVLNRTDRPCTYLIVGTRLPSDTVHYSDVDKLYRRVDGVVTRTRRDGSTL
ncbi:MAG: hypothetical protein RLZZ528_257 [Pseudomonadota bacterium]